VLAIIQATILGVDSSGGTSRCHASTNWRAESATPRSDSAVGPSVPRSVRWKRTPNKVRRNCIVNAARAAKLAGTATSTAGTTAAAATCTGATA
jgi:hypothetical protein